jgi:hypothetical protein
MRGGIQYHEQAEACRALAGRLEPSAERDLTLAMARYFDELARLHAILGAEHPEVARLLEEQLRRD